MGPRAGPRLSCWTVYPVTVAGYLTDPQCNGHTWLSQASQKARLAKWAEGTDWQAVQRERWSPPEVTAPGAHGPAPRSSDLAPGLRVLSQQPGSKGDQSPALTQQSSEARAQGLKWGTTAGELEPGRRAGQGQVQREEAATPHLQTGARSMAEGGALGPGSSVRTSRTSSRLAHPGPLNSGPQLVAATLHGVASWAGNDKEEGKPGEGPGPGLDSAQGLGGHSGDSENTSFLHCGLHGSCSPAVTAGSESPRSRLTVPGSTAGGHG